MTRQRDDAAEVDAGRADVRPALRQLGKAGLLGDDAARDGTGVLRGIAANGLATAFCVWSQRMVLEYLRCCPLSGDLRGLVEGLRSGEVAGATALAPALLDQAGLRPLPLLAEADGAGWRLTGAVPWASNLFDDAVVVTPARTPDGGRLVVLLRLSAAGVHVEPSPELLALNGTGTGSLALDGVAVPPGQVLTDDLAGFLAVCRPTMLLTQAALAVGVADASLAAAASWLHGVDEVLRPDHERLTGRRDDVGVRLDGTSGTHPAQVRLDAMDVAADAVRLETALAGGTGYRAASATSRRVREAAFLPVQAPTLGQLRRAVASSQ